MCIRDRLESVCQAEVKVEAPNPPAPLPRGEIVESLDALFGSMDPPA